MNDPNDFDDPELRARLKRATAGSRPPDAVLNRVRLLAGDTPSPVVSKSRGEFARELIPRLVTLMGVLSLLAGVWNHFPPGEGLRGLADLSRSLGSLVPAFPSSFLLMALFPLVVMLLVAGLRGGTIVGRWND